MNWTQPKCEECWHLEKPDRIPVRITTYPEERCAWCGQPTTSGIYVRADPRLLIYPKADEADE